MKRKILIHHESLSALEGFAMEIHGYYKNNVAIDLCSDDSTLSIIADANIAGEIIMLAIRLSKAHIELMAWHDEAK